MGLVCRVKVNRRVDVGQLGSLRLADGPRKVCFGYFPVKGLGFRVKG